MRYIVNTYLHKSKNADGFHNLRVTMVYDADENIGFYFHGKLYDRLSGTFPELYSAIINGGFGLSHMPEIVVTDEQFKELTDLANECAQTTSQYSQMCR